jgi:hypothetical protein
VRVGLAARAPANAARSWTIALAALAALGAPSAAEAAAPVWCHEVRRGETLGAVAKRARVSVEKLRGQNGLARGEPVRPGVILALPALSALRRGALPLLAAPLRARRGNPARENAAADAQRLTRLRSREALGRFVGAGLLVPMGAPLTGVRVTGMPSWRRVARPWTRQFVRQLGQAIHGLFDAQLRVTGLTRTEAVQTALLAWNGNAAPARGPSRSSHLTGASVDLSKVELSERELHWARLVLGRLTRRGVVLAIEEFAQPHFHVMVLREYADYARRLRSPALIGGC